MSESLRSVALASTVLPPTRASTNSASLLPVGRSMRTRSNPASLLQNAVSATSGILWNRRLSGARVRAATDGVKGKGILVPKNVAADSNCSTYRRARALRQYHRDYAIWPRHRHPWSLLFRWLRSSAKSYQSRFPFASRLLCACLRVNRRPIQQSVCCVRPREICRLIPIRSERDTPRCEIRIAGPRGGIDPVEGRAT